jgi:hypothetical protein
MRAIMTCVMWAAMIVVATGACDKKPASTPRAESAPRPSGPAAIPNFIIADVTPVGEISTETFVRVHFCEESQNEMIVEGGMGLYNLEYRLPSDRESQSMLIEVGTDLFFRMTIRNRQCDYFFLPYGGNVSLNPPTESACAPREGGFLVWADGAVHEYSGSSVKRPQELLWHAQAVRPLKFETGDVERYYRLCDAAARPVWGSPVCVSNQPLNGWRVVSSNPRFPLTFGVVRGKGYVYMYGEGVIEDTQGQPHKFGPIPLESWIAALGSPDPFLRQSAALAIGWLGKEDVETLSALENAASDSVALVRRSVAAALCRLKLPGSKTVLSRLAADEHEWTKITACSGIETTDRQEQEP